MTELDPTAEPMQPLANPALTTSLAPARGRSRFVRYIVGHGWLHLMLLTAVGIFLFPFIYMFGTSMKTDEELTDAAWFPAIPHFQPNSPRVRETPEAARPLEAPPEKWEQVLPQIRTLARAAVDAAPLPPGGDAVNVGQYRAAAAEYLVGRLVSRLNPDLWNGEVGKYVAAFKAALLPDTIADALDSRLARLEFRGLQIRSLDSHIYNITPGDKIAAGWKIESGDAHFIPLKDGAILKYQFGSSSAKPIVLRCEFDFPMDPKNLHKLMLAIKPDDSWHQIDATLDVAGEHWVTDETKYLGTTRNQSILFQPPSFDDTTDRKRIWVPLKKEGLRTEDSGLSKNKAAPSSIPLSPQRVPGDRVIPALSPIPATFRITITPSSTTAAIFGKIERNYLRVFQSIPFWRYVANSALIVGLSTLGAVFSGAFVAYAFARLHWPGRSVAFAILLSTMMLPSQVTMIPSFMVWRALGWYNTLNPLWVPAWFGVAFFIFLMVQHMRTIPRDLEEAARIDGASVLRTWYQIILPETKPALAAIAIMVSMASWNEFMGPLIYLRDQTKFPLSLGLYAMRLDAPEGGVDWTLLMSGNVLMTLPVLLIFFLFQRYFIQGLTMSGMKG